MTDPEGGMSLQSIASHSSDHNSNNIKGKGSATPSKSPNKDGASTHSTPSDLSNAGDGDKQHYSSYPLPTTFSRGSKLMEKLSAEKNGLVSEVHALTGAVNNLQTEESMLRVRVLRSEDIIESLKKEVILRYINVSEKIVSSHRCVTCVL